MAGSTSSSVQEDTQDLERNWETMLSLSRYPNSLTNLEHGESRLRGLTRAEPTMKRLRR
jgi:hypothetical protein